MPDYKETTVAGSSFSRCRLVEIRNPYQQNASVTFTEERITNLEGRVLRDQPDAPIVEPYAPSAVIPLFDPSTLEATGQSVTMQELYVMLFSAYFHFATQRDIRLSVTNVAEVGDASSEAKSDNVSISHE